MSWIKKIFIISSVLLLVTLFFLGIYKLAFKTSSENKITEKAEEYLENKSKDDKKETKEKTASSNKDQKIYAIASESIVGPVLTEGNKIKYYTQSSGNTIEISLDGQEKKIISSANLADLKNVLWNSTQDKVITYFNKEGKASFFLYDFNSKESKQLPDGTDSVNWTTAGNQIIYKFYDSKTKKRSISIADPDGSNWKKLADINFKNVNLAQIPKSPMIAFWNSPNSLETTSLKTVGMMGGETKEIFSGKFGADYLWSPTGEKALVSSVETKGGTKMVLGSINKNGGEYTDLGIPTFVSKCVWSKDGKIIYYALPTFSKGSVLLPDEYLSKKVSSQDTFWKMNLVTGEKERVVELNEIKGNFDAQDLFLSSDEKALFFLNRFDGKLYRIDL